MNEIQERELQIFKEIVNVLDKHNLRYFAVGGTCIGAIRHNGFIPWDDDIDIALPRDEYEKFRTIYYKELPDNLRKIDYDSSKAHDFLFTKIYDADTTYVEKYAIKFPERYTGVFVDIMPVDGMPDNKKERTRFLKKVHLYSRLNGLNRPWIPDDAGLAVNIKQFMKRLMQSVLRFNFFSTKLLHYVRKYNFDSSEFVMFTWRYSSSVKRKVYRKEIFSRLKEVPFEDMYIKVPYEYDEYLTQDFGDYMKLPPKEERHSVHNVCICDMSKPCAYYADLKRKELSRK